MGRTAVIGTARSLQGSLAKRLGPELNKKVRHRQARLELCAFMDTVDLPQAILVSAHHVSYFPIG